MIEHRFCTTQPITICKNCKHFDIRDAVCVIESECLLDFVEGIKVKKKTTYDPYKKNNGICKDFVERPWWNR